MTREEFKTKTDGIRADLLGRLLLCSRSTVDKYRTGALIPEKVARRVTELDKLLQEFRRTNFLDE